MLLKAFSYHLGGLAGLEILVVGDFLVFLPELGGVLLGKRFFLEFPLGALKAQDVYKRQSLNRVISMLFLRRSAGAPPSIFM